MLKFMNSPLITKLQIPQLMNAALNLRLNGKTANSENNLAYLDIDDAYIHELFPLVPDKKAIKPDYFAAGGVGAHITLMYPEEGKKIKKEDIGQTYNFTIKDFVSAKINQKIYYALLIESPTLLQLRKKYSLPDQLCFKGYAIGFHITIAAKQL
jgi:hypothetical protein